MEYTPISSVWEITMACNMRCGHCGSECSVKQPDELTPEEALKLCDNLAELGLKLITLSGGEPFTRPDWHKIAKRLTEHDIITNIISNGWFIDDNIINMASAAGIGTIAISLDGNKEIHDSIRKEGSFNRVMNALEIMKKRGFTSSIVTTIMKHNLPLLPEIKEILINKGVSQWQLQIGTPMGNLKKNSHNVITPDQMEEIIDFAYEVMQEKTIRIALADDIGYYTKKITAIAGSIYGEGTVWQGCGAGKSVIGILHNGEITGCTSLRDRNFIEGSIRETPLKELWTRPGAFAWNRELSIEKLTGFCKKCRYAEKCLGGCTSHKRFTGNTLTENNYCAYKSSIEKLIPKINNIKDIKTLMARAEKSISLNLNEVAEICLLKALEISPSDVNILNMLGYVYFQFKDYKRCMETNKKALKISHNNPYSLKGLGLALAKLGKTKEGVETLKKSIEFAEKDFMDPYHDLAVTLCEAGDLNQALEILEKGRSISKSFEKQSQAIYEDLIKQKQNN
ncbi:MAG: radical SAM protein [Deltaproteobacteria bacterium]|nr:radical SAM protein [Deltaproteobacteria bacterium]